MPSPRARKLNPNEIQKLLDAPKTPRMRELEQLQAVYEGTQYAGRPSFFTDDRPIQERAPCIAYRLTSIAVESNTAFAMGEGRFPTVLSLSSEDDTAFDSDLGLSADESSVVDAFNAKLIDLSRLEQVFRQAYRMSMASRSVAVVLGFRAGLPFADLVWSKLCTPEFSDPTDPYRVTKLTIRYRYTDQWRDPMLTGGEWWTRVFEYLRVIDATADTVYAPVPIWDETDVGAVEGSTPVQSATVHGFNLCPVHWYARNRESLVGVSPDGKAIHDGMLGLLEQLDMTLSQRHRAAVYAGDPQLFISGVDDDASFAGQGRKARPSMMAGDNQGDARQWNRALNGPQSLTGVIRRGAGEVWRAESSAAKATLLTLPGDALKALDDDARDLASKACDGLGVTIVDLSVFKGAGDLSGRTLSFLFSKQINRVSQDREDLGRCCMLPVLNLFYRMLLSVPKGVYLPGLDKVLPILKRFYRSVSGATAKVWFSPSLKLKWGDYFDPSDTDEMTRVTVATAALTGNVITKKSAVEHIKSVFSDIKDVDQYLKTLDAEVQQRQQNALANMQAAAKLAPPTPPQPNGAGSPKPPQATGPTASPPRGNAKNAKAS